MRFALTVGVQFQQALRELLPHVQNEVREIKVLGSPSPRIENVIWEDGEST